MKIVLLLILGFIFFIAWRRKGFIQSETAQRWKFLFPSWRFFEDIGHRFTIWMQIHPNSNWIILRMPVERNPRLLWWNPRGNLALAMDSMTEQFVLDLNTETNSTLLQLVNNQACYLAKELGLSTTEYTQFKICAHTQGDSITSDAEVVFQWTKF